MSLNERLRRLDAQVLDQGSRQVAYFGVFLVVCCLLAAVLGRGWWAVAGLVIGAVVLVAARLAQGTWFGRGSER